MAVRILSEQELIDRVAGAEPKLKRAAVNAIAASRARLGTRAQLSRLIEAGRIEEAVVRSARQGAIDIAQASAAVYVESGQATAGKLSEILRATVDFDQVHDFAVDRIRQNQLLLVREWTQQQRAIAHQVLSDGVRDGLNPVEQARAFRASTGLTARQHQYITNYRAALGRVQQGDIGALSRQLRDRRFDRTVRRAAELKQPLTKQQIDRMVQRYRERSIKRRAETIARTEAMRSVNAGSYDALRQAVDGQHVAEQDVLRTWVAARDERTRPTHVAASGQQVGLNDPFIVGSADLLYPGDPSGPPEETVNCRCTVATRLQV